jgi:4-oxalocrotonate tautomerase
VPFIRIDWFPGRSIEQKRELAEALTREICRIGKCEPDSVGIIFTDIDKEDWARSGKLFADG